MKVCKNRATKNPLVSGSSCNSGVRVGLAAKAEYIVAAYCLDSARYRSHGVYDGMIGYQHGKCCYGENRWQSSADLFSLCAADNDPLAISRFEVLLGNDPSYVNWRDIDRLLQTTTHIAAAFDQNRNNVPLIAVGCKHGNPCGAAVGTNPTDVIHRMAIGDPLALFGGIVMTNFAITGSIAETMLTAGGKRVLDGVVAPSFDEGAAATLRRKNDRCRLYRNEALRHLSSNSLNTSPILVPVRGGFLRQGNYTFILNLADEQVERNGHLDTATQDNVMLAWAVGSTSNSNTVTLVKNGMLIGNGVGQQDRVGCCELAIRRAHRSAHDTAGATAYSDSFFPFPDGPELLARAGVTTIFASSGSVNDQKIRDCCAENDVALWMIPDALGRGFFAH